MKMYYNGKHGKHVETFLNEVHTAVNAKYNAARNNDTVNAMKLQKFFQELKAAAASRKNNDGIISYLVSSIIYNLEKVNRF